MRIKVIMESEMDVQNMDEAHEIFRKFFDQDLPAQEGKFRLHHVDKISASEILEPRNRGKESPADVATIDDDLLDEYKDPPECIFEGDKDG